MPKIICILFFFFSSIFAESTEIIEGRSYRIYNTDTWELVSDLPSSFAILFAEYTENFSGLIYEFFNDFKEGKSSLKGKIYLFQSCEDYSSFLKHRGIKHKNLLYFSKLSSSNWSQFEIAGCTTTTGHLYPDIQKTISQVFLSDKEKNYPLWIKSGFENYFSSSTYIADDLSVKPYLNFDYINLIHRYEQKNKGHITINKLIKSDKISWKNNKLLYKAYSWALIRYLMDVNPNGRNLLKEFMGKWSKNNEKNKASLFSVPEKSGNSTISEEEWFEWLQTLPQPRGIEFYQKAQRQNTHTSRKESLKIATEEFPDYWLYQRDLAIEYLSNDSFAGALDVGEKAIQLKLNSRKTLDVLLISSYRLGQYSRAEFYLWVCDQYGYCKNKYNQERLVLSQYRKNNPDTPKYKPLLLTPGGWF